MSAVFDYQTNSSRKEAQSWRETSEADEADYRAYTSTSGLISCTPIAIYLSCLRDAEKERVEGKFINNHNNAIGVIQSREKESTKSMYTVYRHRFDKFRSFVDIQVNE